MIRYAAEVGIATGSDIVRGLSVDRVSCDSPIFKFDIR